MSVTRRLFNAMIGHNDPFEGAVMTGRPAEDGKAVYEIRLRSGAVYTGDGSEWKDAQGKKVGEESSTGQALLNIWHSQTISAAEGEKTPKLTNG